MDLPPAAQATLRDGTPLRIVGSGPSTEVLVEVESRTHLRGLLDESGAEVAFAAETVLGPGVTAAQGARATILWYLADRPTVVSVSGQEYETACAALATVMPAEPREETTVMTHRTSTVVVLADEQGRYLAELPEGYPVMARGSVAADRVAVTAQFAGYTFRGFLPRDALIASKDPDGQGHLWNSSYVRDLWPLPASWPIGDPCSGTAVLRAGAVVRDGAHALLTTTEEHTVKLQATRKHERLVVLTDVDPAIVELIAWVNASDLNTSNCGPGPPTK